MTDAAAVPAPARPSRGAWAVGIATFSALDGSVLDTWYPDPKVGVDEDAIRLIGALGPDQASVTSELDTAQAVEVLGVALAVADPTEAIRQVRRAIVVTVIADLETPPVDAHDAYLRLHLLSHRAVAPHGLSVEGIFGQLNNVVWASCGPCVVEGFEQTRLQLKAAGHHLTVFGIDKFPRMVDYVVPSGVRIAEADRVRLGAHLAPGTVVMHEGFCNFNAGTLGASMVEGRISAGVVVGDGSDIGGGSSIMGTLSGGGKEVISIGAGCLIGANGGVGISLGDRCTVEAGLYVTAGTRVTLPDGDVVKAAALSGRDDLLFRRNSTTGVVEARPQTVDWGSLNTDLHSHD